MTNWKNLPYEMKCEVFKFLDKENRLKFASCSFQCFRQIVHEEKDVKSVGLEKITEVGTIRPYFIVSVDGSEIRFEQIANMCQIKYDDYVLARGFGKIETTVYKFFHKIWLKHRNTIEKLKLVDVDFTTLQDFSNIKELYISTNNKIHLYHMLSESRNLTKLVVKFEEAEKFEIELPQDFKWSTIRHVDLNCNTADVALDILDKIHPADYASLKCSINGSECDARLIDVLGRFYAIETDLRLTDDQFVQLTSLSTVRNLTFDGSDINLSVIVEYLSAYVLHTRKYFKLNNFHEWKRFEELVMKKYRNRRINFKCFFNTSTNVLSIDNIKRTY